MNTGTVSYIGENLLPGQLGHFFIILSFVAALFSCFSFFRAAQTENCDLSLSTSWKKIARSSFVVHTLSVIGIFSVLYYIITHHLFEYNYAWQHSNRALPMKYLLSCFWEGQEGSFMLWAFWHSMLGLIVMGTSRELESRAMTVVSGIQVLLASMILGFYFSSEIKIGSTPFILLRDSMQNAPIFSDPEYLGKFIKDGNGLNVLLQNYWMVIHPPVLFLGFASTLIPFSFIIAALWKGEYQKFIKPAQVWSLFSGGVLGLGIMMGGAWAYESLNFGGYWAWDPVENASLVPWLTLIAGLHTLIVFKATGRSLVITLILYILTYALIWYSTFLTRTGVLGDTSVHAFTGEGKSLFWHLLVVIALVLITSIALLVKRWKKLPVVAGEEASSSREFWMTIGSFILILSAVHIILVTSIPVWAPLAKWISGKDLAPPVEREQHYNSVQIWIAIITAFLSAGGLYLKFKKTDTNLFWKRVAIILGVSVIISIGIGLAQSIKGIQYLLMLVSAVFALVATCYYAFGVQQGALKKRGAALSHFGFALTLLGVLLSSYGKEVISLNTTGAEIDLGKKTLAESVRESRENVILFRGAKVAMGNYFATYLGDSISSSDPRTFFKVHFERVDTGSEEVKESFMLYPDAFVNPKGQEGLSSNPATRHYVTRDVFTYVNSIYKATEKDAYRADTIKAGDSLFVSNAVLVFEGFNRDAKRSDYKPTEGDVAVGARLSVHTLQDAPSEIQPLLIIRGNELTGLPDTARNIGLFARFANILPEQNAAIIETMQRDAKDEYIVMKALLFPYINVLWLGIITMVVGFGLSTYNRITKKPNPAKTQA